MQITRRELFRWGQGCLAATALPARVFGAASDSPDLLLTLTQQDFAAQIGSKFQTAGPAGQPVWLLLLGAEQTATPAEAPHAPRGHVPRVDTFLLSFSRIGDALPQGTYSFQHDVLGAFPLFIVPSGELTCVATISHLLEAVPPDSIPRRRAGVRAAVGSRPARPLQIRGAETAVANC